MVKVKKLKAREEAAMNAMKNIMIRILRKAIGSGRKGRAKLTWPANGSLSEQAARRLRRHLDYARRLDPKHLTVIRGERTASKYTANLAVAGRL
jgi:hypothetical protein